MVLMADLRERTAECAKYAANSANAALANAVAAAVAVENQAFLSHLQRLVIVNVRGRCGFATGKPVQFAP